MHVTDSVNAGIVSRVVTHGFAQLHSPTSFEHRPGARKFGAGATFEAGLAPGARGLAAAGCVRENSTAGTTIAANEARRVLRRCLS
jgi:hypothetical protein